MLYTCNAQNARHKLRTDTLISIPVLQITEGIYFWHQRVKQEDTNSSEVSFFQFITRLEIYNSANMDDSNMDN